MSTERFPAAADAIASLDDENQRIVLLRLAAWFNNGDEHFDHSDTPGAYSWLCLACAQSGRGPYVVDARTMLGNDGRVAASVFACDNTGDMA